MKVTINYDSNRKPVHEDYAWSTTTYDLDDLTLYEAQKLCADINDENLNVLGRAETEADVRKLFDEYLEENGYDPQKPDMITFEGSGIYILSAFHTLGDAYISRAQETLKAELEDMSEDYREYFTIGD